MYSKILFLYICALSLFSQINCLTRIDLGGPWKVSDENGEHRNLPAMVPGGIYSDLMNNRIIEDVFYGTNDINFRWVAKRNWTFEKNFTVTEELLRHSQINIIFDGIDTFSNVFINGNPVGESDNMFVRYIFNIKSYLKLGENRVKVIIQSPIAKAKELFDVHSKDYEVPPLCVPEKYKGECHVNHIRKMQASFAWDWGPALPSMGIWKQVYLEGFNSSVIRDVTVKTVKNESTNSWDVHLKTYFESLSTVKGDLVVKLFTEVGDTTNIFKLNSTQNEDGDYIEERTISIPEFQVKLWWPNGYGNSTLYTLKVTFVSEDKSEQDLKKMKIGFRTIFLRQNQYYGIGRSFLFDVNDVTIFAKGSNIIPIDILPEKGQNATTIRHLLQSAKDAHMNMLRVWGGGVYESDEFYNVADELGILIWQDFMFACSMYPANEDFLRTVREEVKHQVLRLQHHPSIAVWAGNNENEAALRQNWYGTYSNFTLYIDDYVTLYVDTIKQVYLKYDDNNFLTSSPTNGIESDNEGYVAYNPQDEHFGDVHFYNYIADSWDVNIYPIPRFASEYGYQSLPSLNTLMTITNNISNLQIDGEFMDHRQHHRLGYFEMHSLASKRLKMPEVNDTMRYLKTFPYYSQIMQAMAIKIETEYYRSYRGRIEMDYRGFTGGALYWQLNDVWVAPTWAGIDYNGNWKMLHYFAKEFFFPTIVTTQITSSRELKIFVVNDLQTEYSNATVTVNVFKWNNMTPIHTMNIAATVFKGDSYQLSSLWIDKFLSDLSCGDLNTARVNCFITLSIKDINKNSISPDNFVFPAPLKDVNLKSPALVVTTVEEGPDEKTFKVTVKTDIITLFVWLESGEITGRFSKNGYIQVKPLEEVYFYADSNSTTVSDLFQRISITNLMGIHY